MTSRSITEQDILNARRLKRLYEAKKKSLGMTQTSLADSLNMKQGAVAQYMNGHIALNYEAVIRFARALEIDPWDIDPELSMLNRSSDKEARNVTVDVFSLNGDSQLPLRSITIRYSGMSDRLVGFEPQDNEFAPYLKRGDVAIIDKGFEPEPGDDVIVTLNSGQRIVGELNQTHDWYVRFYDYETMESRVHPADEIDRCDPIVDVQRPLKDRKRRI